MEKSTCDIRLLRESISYDPVSGVCIWKERPKSHFNDDRARSVFNSCRVGKPVGSKYTWKSTGKAYIRFQFFGKSFAIHRAIWAIQTGEWPNVIDHIDGDGLNNVWENLRNTNHQGNAKNAKRYKSRDLPCGIHRRKDKFRAMIFIDGKHYHLGFFDTIDAALLARKTAESNNGFHENHGKIR